MEDGEISLTISSNLSTAVGPDFSLATEERTTMPFRGGNQNSTYWTGTQQTFAREMDTNSIMAKHEMTTHARLVSKVLSTTIGDRTVSFGIITSGHITKMCVCECVCKCIL